MITELSDKEEQSILDDVNSIILAPNITSLMDISKAGSNLNIYPEIINICGESGYLFFQVRSFSSISKRLERIIEMATNHKENFTNMLSELLMKKYYRDDNDKYIRWIRIPYAPILVAEPITKIQDKILVLHTKYDDVYIDISTQYKFKEALFYILRERLDGGWYEGYRNIYWHKEKKPISYIEAAQKILALEDGEYKVSLAWWFLDETRKDEYMGFSIETLIDPMTKLS